MLIYLLFLEQIIILLACMHVNICMDMHISSPMYNGHYRSFWVLDACQTAETL